VGLGFTEGVKPLKINGVEPSVETVQNNTYVLSRPLHMYTNGKPKPGSHLANFINLYKGRDGIRMIEECGFVPVK